MLIDHIFIFCNAPKVADELLAFGLTEGSGRTHQGIGTANRRFFFESFYLEMLWVRDEAEAKSVQDAGIWERSNFQSSGYSRFGLCLKHTEETDPLFANALKWQPPFLPSDQYVDIITNANMPWIFRFPPTGRKNLADEPQHHALGIQQLTQATFHLPVLAFKNQLDFISDNSLINFEQAPQPALLLEFDHGRQGKTNVFENLDLVINY